MAGTKYLFQIVFKQLPVKTWCWVTPLKTTLLHPWQTHNVHSSIRILHLATFCVCTDTSTHTSWSQVKVVSKVTPPSNRLAWQAKLYTCIRQTWGRLDPFWSGQNTLRPLRQFRSILKPDRILGSVVYNFWLPSITYVGKIRRIWTASSLLYADSVNYYFINALALWLTVM